MIFQGDVAEDTDAKRFRLIIRSRRNAGEKVQGDGKTVLLEDADAADSF